MTRLAKRGALLLIAAACLPGALVVSWALEEAAKLEPELRRWS